MRGSSRNSELAMEEIEEARVSEIGPRPLPIELRKRNQELCHRSALATQEVREPAGENACIDHEVNHRRAL